MQRFQSHTTENFFCFISQPPWQHTESLAHTHTHEDTHIQTESISQLSPMQRRGIYSFTNLSRTLTACQCICIYVCVFENVRVCAPLNPSYFHVSEMLGDITWRIIPNSEGGGGSWRRGILSGKKGVRVFQGHRCLVVLTTVVGKNIFSQRAFIHFITVDEEERNRLDWSERRYGQREDKNTRQTQKSLYTCKKAKLHH